MTGWFIWQTYSRDIENQSQILDNLVKSIVAQFGQNQEEFLGLTPNEYDFLYYLCKVYLRLI